MISIKKSTTLTGNSVINGVIVERYQATINSDDPAEMTISRVSRDKEAYKANREQCRKDSAEFEDYAYTIQDEMIASMGNETENLPE